MTLATDVGYIRLERCPVTDFRHINLSSICRFLTEHTPSHVNSLLHSKRTASLKVERLPVTQEAAGSSPVGPPIVVGLGVIDRRLSICW
jgi:hypothetical protein